jgi:hypothetical protein
VQSGTGTIVQANFDGISGAEMEIQLSGLSRAGLWSARGRGGMHDFEPPPVFHDRFTLPMTGR